MEIIVVVDVAIKTKGVLVMVKVVKVAEGVIVEVGSTEEKFSRKNSSCGC